MTPTTTKRYYDIKRNPLTRGSWDVFVLEGPTKSRQTTIARYTLPTFTGAAEKRSQLMHSHRIAEEQRIGMDHGPCSRCGTA